MTLSVIGATAEGDLVMSRTSTRGVGKVFYAGSTASETFATKRNAYGTALTTDRRLRIDFASPVSAVSLKAVSASLTTGVSSVGRFDAYDINNNLIGRYTTGALGIGGSEIMSLTRTAADIKYVIASSHLETEVLFDSLVIGPTTQATTKPDGSFEIAALPPGQYNLKVVTSPNYTPVSPLDEFRVVNVLPGSSDSNNLYFAFQFTGNPWHNLIDPLNANGVGGITAFDALLVINYLNLHPGVVTLVAGEAQPNNYIDINNDNKATAFDALAVINWLNLHFGSGAGSEGPKIEPTNTELVGGGSVGGGDDSGGEIAAFIPEVAQSADQYFAANPLHISQRFKDDNHDHDHGDDHDHVEFVAHDDHDHDDHSGPFDFSFDGADDAAAGIGGVFDTQVRPSIVHSSDNAASKDLFRGLRTNFAATISPLLERLRALRLTKDSKDHDSTERSEESDEASNLYDLLAADRDQFERLARKMR